MWSMDRTFPNWPHHFSRSTSEGNSTGLYGSTPCTCSLLPPNKSRLSFRGSRGTFQFTDLVGMEGLVGMGGTITTILYLRNFLLFNL